LSVQPSRAFCERRKLTVKFLFSKEGQLLISSYPEKKNSEDKCFQKKNAPTLDKCSNQNKLVQSNKLVLKQSSPPEQKMPPLPSARIRSWEKHTLT